MLSLRFIRCLAVHMWTSFEKIDSSSSADHTKINIDSNNIFHTTMKFRQVSKYIYIYIYIYIYRQISGGRGQQSWYK
jgi:hypothetical protein